MWGGTVSAFFFAFPLFLFSCHKSFTHTCFAIEEKREKEKGESGRNRERKRERVGGKAYCESMAAATSS